MTAPLKAAAPGVGEAQNRTGSFTPEKISKLVQMLAATKLENERLRSAALPDRTNAELEKLLAENLPYAWMQSLTVALREYSRMDSNQRVAQSIWTVVHEELRHKRQGRNSTMPIPQPQSQGPIVAPGMMMCQQGMQMTTPRGPRIIGGPQNNMQCFICGGPGHWARNCPQVAVTGTLHQPHVRAKISQLGDQTILCSNLVLMTRKSQSPWTLNMSSQDYRVRPPDGDKTGGWPLGGTLARRARAGHLF